MKKFTLDIEKGIRQVQSGKAVYMLKPGKILAIHLKQGIFHINYLEKDSTQIKGKSVSMPLRAVLHYPDLTIVSQNVSGIHLLQTLAGQIPVSEGVKRKLTGFDFTFLYGGEELALFANSGMNPKGSEGMVVDLRLSSPAPPEEIPASWAGSPTAMAA